MRARSARQAVRGSDPGAAAMAAAQHQPRVKLGKVCIHFCTDVPCVTMTPSSHLGILRASME